jgi:hypothetical protein
MAGTIQRHCREAAVPTPSCPLGPTVVGLPAGPPLIARGMGSRLARHDAGPALVLGQRTKRLLAVASIAQSGHLMRRHRLGMFAEPPCARRLCAVLLGLPVLRHDVRGGQGDDVGASWAHDDGGERGVRREGVTGRAVPGEAVGAMDGLGRTGGRASEGDHQVITQPTTVVAQAVRLETLEELLQHGLAGARRAWIAPRTALMVTGHLRDAQQGLGVRAPLGGWPAAVGLSK